jgi:hypothetical protein
MTGGRGALRVVLLLVGVAAGWACARGEDDLASRIAAVVARGAGSVVEFAALTDFAWDRLHIFPPHTRLDQITAQLGFEWSLAPAIGLQEQEHLDLLVFVRGGEVVRYVLFPRYTADFAGPFRSDGYAPEEAVFVVRKEEGGYSPWILRARPSPPNAQQRVP